MKTPSTIAAELEAAFNEGASDRELLVLICELRAAIDAADAEMIMVAKLASTEPKFFNPIHAMEAGVIRDRILRESIDSPPVVQSFEAYQNQYYANNLRQ